MDALVRDPAALIQLGTSGFSYDDWHGPFYPPELAKAERLSWYARHFDTVEINSTYYHSPSARMTAGLLRKVPDTFRFAVKVFGGITHELEPPLEAELQRYRDGIHPLIEAGQLGAVLAQFPQRFRPSRDHVDRLRQLQRAWPDLPLVIEFRHRDWLTERAVDWLRDHGLSLCCIDGPDLPALPPPLAVATGPIGYVRFHGRNAEQWYEHDEPWQRYEHHYTDDELRPWIDRLRQVAESVEAAYVYFNNHPKAEAVNGARRLADLLRETAAEQGAGGGAGETEGTDPPATEG